MSRYNRVHESDHAQPPEHPAPYVTGDRFMRGSRSTLVVGAVVAGSVVAALTGHASAWAPARDGVARPTDLLMVLAVAALLGFIPTWAILRRRLGRAPSVDTLVPTAAALTAAIALFGIAQLPLYPPLPIQGTGQEPDSTRLGVRLESDWVGPAHRRGGEADGFGPGPSSPDHAAFVRYLLIVLLAAAVVGVVALVRARRQPEVLSPPPALPPFDDGARARAHGAVLVTIDAMLDDPDPRTAIIGAYARLLEELEATGAARFDYEGPQEHLRRVLSVLRVQPKPLEALIALFEEARFSEHELTLRHRDEALRALESVAGALASPTGSAIA